MLGCLRIEVGFLNVIRDKEPMQLVLASTSPYRRALMERLGLQFRAVTPLFDEAPPGDTVDPAELVVANAVGKAHSLLARYPGALVIGSDQVAVCEGEILTKPGSEARALAQILRLAGKEHRLLTAVALVGAPEKSAARPPAEITAEATAGATEESPAEATAETELVESRLRMRPLTRREAERYIRRERPVDCVGAYKSEGLGITLFEYLRGDDPTAIVGLPLIALTRLLKRFGVNVLGTLKEAGEGKE
jgi:septum formation protein